MTIKQLNASYLMNEDRILFRFNTQDLAEYRLWLTRRVTLFILAATSHLLTKKLEQEHPPDTAKALNEFEKQALLEQVDSKNKGVQNYESGLIFPLGFDPVLVMDVTCALYKNGGTDSGLSIDFALPGGANVNLKLTENMIRGLCLLLDKFRTEAGWGEAHLRDKIDAEIEMPLDDTSSRKISLH